MHTLIHVAIVGSGPSGFYAAEALLRSGQPVCVNMLERLPVPYGLVRSGVAPDHPKLKEVMRVYDRIARMPGFQFFGNVAVGRDVTVEELRASHHALIFACGAQTDRRMNIPGEDLPGSHTATEFVGWFNGHPDYRDRTFDLTQEVAVIVGQGNVAADLCRILAKPVDELRCTDITEHALDVLAQSRLREIHVIGRRGPAQAKFTARELRELGEIADCTALADPAEIELSPQSEAELAHPDNLDGAKNVELFRRFARNEPGCSRRTLRFRFGLSPVALRGAARVEAMVLARNRLEGPPFEQRAVPTGGRLELPCGLVFRSIGYRGVPISGLPFDERSGTVPHTAGRVRNGDELMSGVYVTGWLKRGPTGVIGTNRADSVETVEGLLGDLPQLHRTARAGAGMLRGLLERRGVRALSYEHWLSIDAEEVRRGAPKGKPREKFTRVAEMLGCVAQQD